MKSKSNLSRVLTRLDVQKHLCARHGYTKHDYGYKPICCKCRDEFAEYIKKVKINMKHVYALLVRK